MGKPKVKKLISSINFSEAYDKYRKSHQVIFDHIDQLRPPHPSSAISPSLIFYTARNILAPSFIIGQIPDLLNTLVAVETFRRFAALKCEEALEWQTYYEREKSQGRGQDVRLLAANELRALQRFKVQKAALRREYIVLVRALILFYIHYLLTAPESCLLGERLNDFFLGSIQGIDAPSELLIHTDLSEEEKLYFGRLKLECQEWLTLVIDWDDKREEACKHEGQTEAEMEKSFADDFRHAFPPPSEPLEMARNVEIYLKKVEDMILKLEQWFPPPLQEQ